MLLALSNVGYFLWARGIGQPEDAASATSAVPPLKLASEAPQAVRAASDGTNAGGAPDPATGPAVTRCVSIGPFRDVSEAAHAASTLRGGGYDPRQRVVEGEVWAGVWVYLPLPPNRAAADQLAAKLRAGGIDDALEMPGPADGSVMSLGLYSEQRRAQARVAQAQALGFNPAIADRKRTGTLYWIDIDLKPSDASIDPADLQGEAGRINRLEVQACAQAAVVQP